VNHFKKITLLAFALMLMSAAVSHARTSPDYRFKIHNSTENAITKVLVSEDGKTYGYFDIGDGIAAGATEELVWAKSTDNGACEWYFKAVFDNGEESQAVQFDFCEKNLVLEFN
jgi:hypothetical protein